MWIDEKDFNREWEKSIQSGKITEQMGRFLLGISENIAKKYSRSNPDDVVLEMKDFILFDAVTRFFDITVRKSPIATFITTMTNRAKNFFRDTKRGNIDIFGTKIGYGRGSRWINKEFRKLKIEKYGNTKEIERRIYDCWSNNSDSRDVLDDTPFGERRMEICD